MIFKILAALTGERRHSDDMFAYGNDQISRVFLGDTDAILSPETIADRERRRAKERAKRKKRIEAINFFTRGFHTLADAHVKALEECNQEPSREKLKELESLISRGRKSLVMQADLLFGPETVNGALKECGHDPREFRKDAFA